MFTFTGFSESADRALNNGIRCAEDMGHTYIGSEHILAGLLEDSSNAAAIIMESKKVTFRSYVDILGETVGTGLPTCLTENDITPRGIRILKNAMAVSASSGSIMTGTEHILTALLRESQCFACRILMKMGVSPSEVYSGMRNGRREANGKNKSKNNASFPTLSKYGRNMTAAAFEGKTDPVTGRDREIDRVIKILSRRTKNNPCLIGEPGVGKTAVAEGLALRIASGQVPLSMKNTEIWSLELTGMVAGAKYRGDFEERIKNAVSEAASAGNIVLFIDEIHNLTSAGSAEGAVDAGNILKPVLARGEIKLIGATTNDEYRKNIEKDAALERRFQTVIINEPSKEETVEILRNLRPSYENFHMVKISDEAVNAAVELSCRFIPGRYLPDKAIDLLDEASAAVHIKGQELPLPIKELEKTAEDIGRKKEEAVNGQDFEKAAELRNEEKQLLEELSEKKHEWSENESFMPPEVTENHISEVLSEWTGIPTGRLCESEKIRLKSLEEKLKSRIAGQDRAVKTLSTALKRSRLGIKSPERPAGVFLFCGPTGVGKTELAKQLAEAYFGDRSSLIKFDMSEFSEKHSLSSLIGAPPGYAGFDRGGRLINEVRKKPYSVILFDEIEKAHPDIFDFLLPVLDEGIITASDGRQASCRNSVIIMTSNAGARQINESRESIGFGEKASDENTVKSAVNRELGKIFPPEFLNRIDEKIIFSGLGKRDIEKIALSRLEELKSNLEKAGILISFGEGVASYLAEKGHSEIYGARNLGRLITEEIESPLSEILLDNDENVNKMLCESTGTSLSFQIL